MAARRIEIIGLLLCFCLCLMPCYAQAVSTADAAEPIQSGRDCTLTIVYQAGASACSDLPVALYQIAEISADFRYTPVSAFLGSGLALNGIRSNGEWDVIRSTLESYVIANGIAATATARTDQTGEVRFTALKPGLYLATVEPVINETGTYLFDPALVALPGLGTDGRWQYQVAVTAKPGFLPPVGGNEEIQLKVLKLWKGDEGKDTRPRSVEVEIFRDGQHYQTVTLSEENHWSYSWTTKESGAVWTVAERNIPSGYKATLEKRSTAFILTNTLHPDDSPDDPPNDLPDNPPDGDVPPDNPPSGDLPPDSPRTGDSPHILLYTVLMYLSGLILILLGITGKKQRT